MSPNLEALADLEWLLRDRGDAPVPSDAERQAVGSACAEAGLQPADARARLDGDRGLRQRIALAWLQAARRVRPELPGAAIGRGLAFAGFLLVVLGLACGWLSAKGLLAYDGRVPVNVLHFGAALFLVQILLLLFLLWFVLRRKRSAAPGGPHQLIAWLAGWLANRFAGRAADVRDALRTLHDRHGLYADVERWTLFALAQRFGFAFNIGAVAATWFTVAFSDLQFCWSTTFDLTPATAHAAARGLAMPWSWLPAAVPSLDLVTASQWARMPGGYIGGMSTEQALRLAPQWWSFLLAGLVAYGLVPRGLALLAGGLLARRAAATASCDHAGFQELFDRLLPHSSGWQGPDPAAVRGAAPGAPAHAQTAAAPAGRGGQALVVWGSLGRSSDAVRAELGRRGGAVAVATTAGGSELAADDAAIARVAGAAPVDNGRIVVAIAAGHQPTGDVLGFLRRLRAAVGKSRPLVVTLLEPAADGAFLAAETDERASWRRSLGALGDPYLWVDGGGTA